MKYLEDRHFLYPVLRPFSDDYPGGEFYVADDLASVIEEDRILLRITFCLREPSIQEAINQGWARFGAVLYCPPTLYRNLASVPHGQETLSISIQRSQMHGALEINPLVYACKDFLYQPHTVHPEYRGFKRCLNSGSVLAQEETINLTFPPPAFMQHFVSWRLDSSLPDFEFRLDKEDSRFLYICTNQTTRKALYQLSDLQTKPSFYLGVLHDLLAHVQLIERRNELVEARENHEWLDGLLSNLEIVSNIDFEQLGNDGQLTPWQVAQRLLKHPYSLLQAQEDVTT